MTYSSADREILKKARDEAWETEHHVHGWEDWGGLAAVPAAETHRVDFDVMTPFQMDAGNDTWGSWLQIVGSSDTPVRSGNVKFDIHRILITDVERDLTITRIQIGCGASGADSLAAGTYTEFMITPQKNARSNPFDIMMKRCSVGEKVWARCWVNGQNTGTVDFFFGIHEYER
jgi:hypothetical protein